MTVRELGRKLRAGDLSCIELMQETLGNLRSREAFHSFITKTEESALELAQERDRELARGIDRGPFHGIPIAHKDLFYTRGVRTTAGSLLFKNFIPDYDAAVVKRLDAAGAISVGKTNLHELAYGITSKNPHYGFVLNPLDTTRIAGGSSGGSAALIAAGLLPFATGTDTGGSIRIPASYCGITGLKPTYDRVSRRGILPLAFTLDHAGPLGSCVEDCALAMNAMTREEFNLPLLDSLTGVRIGMPKNFYFERVDEEVAAAVRKAASEMEEMGASIAEIRVPDMEQVNAAARIVQMAETSAVYSKETDATLFAPDVWALLQQGRLIAGHEYVNAQRVRTLFRSDFDRLWEKVDLLITPTTPITAPRLDETSVQIGSEKDDVRLASTRLVRAINFLGEPALSMPCGKSASGLPIGLQLISAPFSDARLLRIGKTVEPALA